MRHRTPTVVSFAERARDESSQVGRVHESGSITFRGRTYRTIKEVPPECLAFRVDLETYAQWRRLYRAIAPAGGGSSNPPTAAPRRSGRGAPGRRGPGSG
jgi:hypothetical protein